jgi:hypothetical protein
VKSSNKKFPKNLRKGRNYFFNGVWKTFLGKKNGIYSFIDRDFSDLGVKRVRISSHYTEKEFSEIKKRSIDF